MFKPKTEKIAELAQKNPHRIQELESIFDKKTNIYIDFANVFRWQEKLFATVRKIASELNDLKKDGLFIFEIQKLKDFICWPRDSMPI